MQPAEEVQPNSGPSLWWRREVSSLPLAPHTLTLLLRNGFRTVKDLRGFRPSKLASELGVTPMEAYEIISAAQAPYTGETAAPTTSATSGQPPPPPPTPTPTTTAPTAPTAIPATPHTPATRVSTTPYSASTPRTSVSQVPSASVPRKSTRKTAQEMYKERKSRKAIITFCKAIDTMLGGGVRMGEIIEICGVPGIGKTQVGMQLAIDVQIPEEFSGAGGEAIYIDTEGSFMVERAADMSREVSKHIHRLATSKKKENQLRAVETITDLSFLNGIHLMRVHDHTEQIAAVNHLPNLLRANPRVRLVIIDSIAFHFRHGSNTTNFAQRNRLLTSMAQKLNEIANHQQVAVVLMNQMTTRMDSTAREGSKLVPALGESWAHSATHRMQLYWGNPGSGLDGGVGRFATLLKSSSQAGGIVQFDVTSMGVRDVRPAKHGPSDTALNPDPKRHRTDPGSRSGSAASSGHEA